MTDDIAVRLAMAPVRQRLPRPRVEGLAGQVAAQVRRLGPCGQACMSVAVTAGSRGISAMPLILGAVVSSLKEMGAKPYVVSAMGSHGGGTVEGQRHLLAHLGVTEESVGAPLRVTSEAVAVGTTEGGHVLYADGEAVKADAILPVNRIKAHTAFQADLASGLFKMLTVGLGKAPGAAQVHKLAAPGIFGAIVEMGRLALGAPSRHRGPRHHRERLRGDGPRRASASSRDGGAGKGAAEVQPNLPALPARTLDLLIVDEMGKDFSGTGMDTNIIGRWRVEGIPEPEFPRIGRIVALRLSRGSEGNANGIGLADFTTRKLANAIDWTPTLMNVRTTGFGSAPSARLPWGATGKPSGGPWRAWRPRPTPRSRRRAYGTPCT